MTHAETTDPSPGEQRPARGRSAWPLVAGLAGLLAATWAAVTMWGPVALRFGTLGTLLVLALLAEGLRRVELTRSTTLSVVAVIILGALPLAGPLGAGLVGFVSALLVQPRGMAPVGRAFNAVQQGLIGTVGGVVYLLAGGTTSFPTGDRARGVTLVVHSLLPLVLAALVMMLLNATLVSTIMHVWSGEGARSVFLDTLSLAWMTYLGFGVVGFMFVVLWVVEGLGPVSVVLVVAPLMLAQWSIHEQADEREAQLKTVQTLVAAAETGRFQRPGQSERVRQVCEAIAVELRLSPGRSRSLRFAASLHNIGLVAPPSPDDDVDALDRARVVDILEHPVRGVAMLGSIDFLGDAVDAVRSHHERWDGGGFPDGLSGSRIPLLARVLAVADTYVALTWGPDPVPGGVALALVEERAGTHLDPGCVTALRRASVRGRLPDVPAPGVLLGPDHDHPDVLDAVCESGIAR